MLDNPAADVATGLPLPVPSSSARPLMLSGHHSDSGLHTRLPRTRKSSRRDDSTSSSFFTTSGEGTISSGQLFVKIPASDPIPGRSPRSAVHQESALQHRPPRPSRRPHPSSEGDELELPIQRPWIRPRTLSSGATESRPVVDTGRGRQANSENGELKRGQRPRVLSLPRHAFRTGSNSDSSEQASPLTPSAFNDIPPMPIFARNRRYRHQPRDSGVTHQSTTSSSLYPRSSSTGESYLSPPSLPPNDPDHHIITVDPEDNPHFHELNEMDADDVSYRLRLLMQNNYYLPPAHSKPFSEYPVFPEPPKKSPLKSSSPNFLDIFKVGKKKGSSPEQKTAKGASAPMLRTTSDNSTVSGMARPRKLSQPVQPRANVMSMTTPPQPRPDTGRGRVVVVRERMEDIASVAKQVEQDLKQREAERRRNVSEASHSEHEELQGGLIDPTDAVDLPPVSANGMFGPQASALNGMGVEASVGAAALADRLPPSSPGMWSVDTEEEAWRKALLQEAVGHSLNNSPAVTPARTPSHSSPFLSVDLPSTPSPIPQQPLSSSLPSPRPSTSPAPALGQGGGDSSGGAHDSSSANSASREANSLSLPRRKRELGQRILSRMIDDAEIEGAAIPASPLETVVPETSATEVQRQPSSSTQPGRSLRLSSAGSYVPIRAETPTVPTHPLAPPPRRPNLTPGHSSDSPQENGNGRDQGGEGPVVDGESSFLQFVDEQDTTARLSNAYETHVGLSGAFGELTPPPDSAGSGNNSATLSAVLNVSVLTPSMRGATASLSSGSRYSEDDQDDTAFHTPMEHTMSTFDGSRPSLTVSSVRTSSEYSQPSPTTSAFRDAFDHSPYGEGSPRHSVINTLGGGSRGPSRTSDHHTDPRYAAVSPPPRTSSSLAHTALHPPPYARHYESMYRSSFDNISERSPTPHADEDEPRTPTGRLYPPAQMTLAPPSMSPYPPSPISFFDAVEMQSGAEEEESSEGEEEEGEEEEAQDDGTASVAESDAEAGVVIVDPLTGGVHNLARDPRQPLGAVAQSQSASTPRTIPSELGSHRETSSTLGYETLERHNALVGGAPHSASTRSTFSLKSKGKGREQIPPVPAVPAAPRVSESMFDRLKHKASMPPGGQKRPQTASAAVGRSPVADSNVHAWRDEQNLQDQSSRRLDGMLIEHMERERDILRRITTTLTKP